MRPSVVDHQHDYTYDQTQPKHRDSYCQTVNIPTQFQSLFPGVILIQLLIHNECLKFYKLLVSRKPKYSACQDGMGQ